MSLIVNETWRLPTSRLHRTQVDDDFSLRVVTLWSCGPKCNVITEPLFIFGSLEIYFRFPILTISLVSLAEVCQHEENRNVFSSPRASLRMAWMYDYEMTLNSDWNFVSETKLKLHNAPVSRQPPVGSVLPYYLEWWKFCFNNLKLSLHHTLSFYFLPFQFDSGRLEKLGWKICFIDKNIPLGSFAI